MCVFFFFPCFALLLYAARSDSFFKLSSMPSLCVFKCSVRTNKNFQHENTAAQLSTPPEQIQWGGEQGWAPGLSGGLLQNDDLGSGLISWNAELRTILHERIEGTHRSAQITGGFLGAAEPRCLGLFMLLEIAHWRKCIGHVGSMGWPDRSVISNAHGYPESRLGHVMSVLKGLFTK